MVNVLLSFVWNTYTGNCFRAIHIGGHKNVAAATSTGVAGEMAHAGAHGAALNIFINLKNINEEDFSNLMQNDTENILKSVDLKLAQIRKTVYKIIAQDAWN